MLESKKDYEKIILKLADLREELKVAKAKSFSIRINIFKHKNKKELLVLTRKHIQSSIDKIQYLHTIITKEYNKKFD